MPASTRTGGGELRQAIASLIRAESLGRRVLRIARASALLAFALVPLSPHPAAAADAASDSFPPRPPAPNDSALVPGPGPAARPGVADTVTVLPPVRVESTRSLIPDRTTATTVRLDRSRIVQFLPATASDALVSVPGVDLVKTGPWASRVSLRGLSGDRVLVLVDGVRINTLRGHGAQSALVSIDRLDAVELMPGASSAQFGSDALGGVINFVTRRSLLASSRSASLILAARGSDPGGMWSQSGRVAVVGPRLGAELAGGLGGLEALVTPRARIANSGSHEQNLAGRIASQFGGTVFDFEHARQAAYDVGLPAFNNLRGASAEYPLQSRDVDRLELTRPSTRAWPEARLLAVSQRLRTHFTETTVDSMFRFGRFIGTRTTVAADRVRTRATSVQPALRFVPLAGLRLSGEYRHETTGGPRETSETTRNASDVVSAVSTGIGESMPPARRDVWSAAAFAAPRARAFKFEAGVRWDELRSHADSTATSSTSKLEVTDHRISGEAGLARRVGGLEPYVHFATGFRAPNLEERYFNDDIHGGFRLFGNPDLVAERSASYESGLRGTEIGPLRSARVSAYRSDVDDLISFTYVGQLYLVPRFQYVNVKHARIEGLEASAQVLAGPVSIGFEGTAPRAVDRMSGKRLTDAGAARATLDLAVPIRRLLPEGTFALRVRWNDALTGVDSTFARPAFSTTSVEVSSVISGLRAVFAVHNLMNASYRESLSFIDEPGRTFALSLRSEFHLAPRHSKESQR